MDSEIEALVYELYIFTTLEQGKFSELHGLDGDSLPTSVASPVLPSPINRSRELGQQKITQVCNASTLFFFFFPGRTSQFQSKGKLLSEAL